VRNLRPAFRNTAAGLSLEKWLVASNCNRVGLANSVSLLCPDITVETVHLLAFARDVAAGTLDPGGFDRAILHPKIDQHGGPHVAALRKPVYVPSLFFCGYHPDVCPVLHKGANVQSPVGDNHSAICFTAHQAGLSPIEAERLFTRQTYEDAGYFDVWDADRESEIDKFAAHGIDIAPLFVRWSRTGSFMHTVNHPVIEVIYTIARMALARDGIPHVASPYRPQDNLIDATTFPIYPEIGEAFGVTGSMLFKRGGQPRLIGLRQFIRSCYALYDRLGRESLVNGYASWDRFVRLKAMIA